MPPPNAARVERAALADLLAELGPDQPTLCEGWTTRDLAAHIVLRDRRPDVAAGAVIKPLAARTARITARTATARRFNSLIDDIRTPPWWSFAAFGPADRAANTAEFFVHHEDVRRAQPDWSARPLDPDLGKALFGQVKVGSRLRLRRYPATIEIHAPGYGGVEPVTAGAGGPSLILTGDPGELTMFLGGRQRAARVEIDGAEDPVERFRSADLRI